MKKVLLFVAALAFVACNNNQLPVLTGMSLNKSKLELAVGESRVLYPVFEPEDAAPEIQSGDITWDSSDPVVATVNRKGQVDALSVGKTFITATYGEFIAECKVTVVDDEPEPEPDAPSVIFDVTKADLAIGETLTINVSFDPETTDRKVEDLTWISTDPDVASVENGTVTAINTGTAIISGFYTIEDKNGVTTTYGRDCEINVKPGAIVYPGFSVSADKKVIFSQGNLQYHTEDKRWRFADIHNDDFHAISGSLRLDDENFSGWIELFGWGSGNNPTNVSEDESTYKPFHEWGENDIWNGGSYEWRTPTKEEWLYVTAERPNASRLRTVAIVKNIEGMILLPDDAKIPDDTPLEFSDNIAGTANVLSINQWDTFVAKTGAIFLPKTGTRMWFRGELDLVGSDCCYWSSYTDGSAAYFLYYKLNGSAPAIYNTGLAVGKGVRLVCEE